VMPPCAPAPSQPPSAPRSCVRTAALAPCNSRAADQPDPCGRSRSQDLRHRTQTAIHSQWRRREPRGGPGCLNRISASISRASAGVRLPSGGAAA
jgi:hypothetical protein